MSENLKERRYVSRKFWLTFGSLWAFVMLLWAGKLPAEPFADLFGFVFASYALANVAEFVGGRFTAKGKP